MPKKPMEVTNRDVPRLEYTPLLSANFEPVSVVIPKLTEAHHEGMFGRVTQIAVQRACGEVSCKANVIFSGANGTPSFPGRIIVGATIDCANAQCPLDGPPEAGDREPLNPAPSNPGLRVEAELPAISVDSHA